MAIGGPDGKNTIRANEPTIPIVQQLRQEFTPNPGAEQEDRKVEFRAYEPDAQAKELEYLPSLARQACVQKRFASTLHFSCGPAAPTRYGGCRLFGRRLAETEPLRCPVGPVATL